MLNYFLLRCNDFLLRLNRLLLQLYNFLFWLCRFRNGLFMNWLDRVISIRLRIIISISSVNFVEVNTFFHHNGLELSKWTVDQVTHGSIGSERDFLSSIDKDTLTCIYVDALACIDARHLERTEPLNLQCFFVMQGIVHHIHHAGDELIGLSFADTKLIGHGSGYIGKFNHWLYLLSLAVP